MTVTIKAITTAFTKVLDETSKLTSNYGATRRSLLAAVTAASATLTAGQKARSASLDAAIPVSTRAPVQTVTPTPVPASRAGEPAPAVAPADEHAQLPFDPRVARRFKPEENKAAAPFRGSVTVGPGGDIEQTFWNLQRGQTRDLSVFTLLPGLKPDRGAGAHIGAGNGQSDIMIRARKLGDVTFGDMDAIYGKCQFHVSGARLTVENLAFDSFMAGYKDGNSSGQAAIYAESADQDEYFAPTRLDVRGCDIDNIGGNGIFTQTIEALRVSDTMFSKAMGNGRTDQRSHDIYSSASTVRVLHSIAGGHSLGNSWKFRDNAWVEVIRCFMAMHANGEDNPRFLDVCANTGKVLVKDSTMVQYPDVKSRAGQRGGTPSRNLIGFGEEKDVARPTATKVMIDNTTLFLCLPGSFIHVGPRLDLDARGLKIRALRGSGVTSLVTYGSGDRVTVGGDGWRKQVDGSWSRPIRNDEFVDSLPIQPESVAALAT